MQWFNGFSLGHCCLEFVYYLIFVIWFLEILLNLAQQIIRSCC
ncbi:hypothetical protein D1AOALGA4SA_4667 [Olavius algarvensis Delta 1 endosymbiont]|nr:hypothetical protein D1AOALGA4SA_4667 [Olavius algarvensis Delta 1 endosymbiont]